MTGQHQEELFSTGWAQRWRGGLDSWRHTSQGGFDPGRYEVVPLAEAPARAFIAAHHYLSGWPAAVHRYGLEEGGRLVGVVVLSSPMHRAVLTNVFPGLEPYTETLECSRLCLLDDIPAPAESWFCARAHRYAAEAGVRGVVSFADPVPRRRLTERGEIITTPGHAGILYQALNYAYLGRGTARTLTVLPDGSVLTARAMAKVTRVAGAETGADAVERRLIGLGARPHRPGQSGRAWLAAALETAGAVRMRHPGNHRYALRIGRTRAERTRTVIAMTSQPFPKPARPCPHPA